MAGTNTYYQITTTAVFSGNVTISINYDPAGIKSPGQLKLFHFDNGSWIDVTTSVDTANHIIYGKVTSLSPFGVFEPGAALGIISDSLPEGAVGKSYNATLAAFGGTAPYHWSVQPGTLPPGLSIDSSTGVVSGIPTGAGTFSIVFDVVDSSAPADHLSKAVTIKIYAKGDANADWKVNILDVTKVERIILGLDPITCACDANGDGKVNILDVTKVERFILGLDQ
jgi:hypothetical protein